MPAVLYPQDVWQRLADLPVNVRDATCQVVGDKLVVA